MTLLVPEAPDGLTDVIEFYAASTSGGTVDVLNTVTLVNGIVQTWAQAGPSGAGTPIGLLLALTRV